MVAGSVCNKGHLLKVIGSLNLIKTVRVDLSREGARMGSKLLRLKKGLRVCLWWKVHLAYPASYRHATQIILKQIMQIEHNRNNKKTWRRQSVCYLQAWLRI